MYFGPIVGQVLGYVTGYGIFLAQALPGWKSILAVLVVATAIAVSIGAQHVDPGFFLALLYGLGLLGLAGFYLGAAWRFTVFLGQARRQTRRHLP